jgi:hypothetical protein
MTSQLQTPSLYAPSSHVPGEIRALLGIKRISSKMTLEDIIVKAFRQMETVRTREGAQDVRTAIYGLSHALRTARVDGYREQIYLRLQGKAAVGLVQRIVEMNLTGDDVARYLNGRRFTHDGFRWRACYD